MHASCSNIHASRERERGSCAQMAACTSKCAIIIFQYTFFCSIF
uniref:Uncharacterized protein n=1 Tax=Arundo donax TaxID=35708 RepID=A0A0A9CFS3_ARUDO